MKTSIILKTAAVLILFAGAAWALLDQPLNRSESQQPTTHLDSTLGAVEVLATPASDTATAATRSPVIHDQQIQLCQGYDNFGGGCDGSCGGTCNGDCGTVPFTGGFGYAQSGEATRMMRGIDNQTPHLRREAHWRNGDNVPWENFGFGEYIGPHRAPHVADYQLRVDDRLEFVYLLTREKSVEAYQFYVGDVLQLSSPIDATLNQTNIPILPDGTISLALIGQVRVAGKTVEDLQRELNDKYKKYVKNPSIVVQVLKSETPLQDLRDSVDARAGQGGQARQATVNPDGTVQLPLIGSVPAIGLTLDEIGREVNARYHQRLRGIEVTPILIQRAPRFVYVVGEVNQGGRFEMTGPTTALQAITLANGFRQGGNIRQVIVFRRDQNWQLTATKLDLGGALFGKTPMPSDEIWLRDSDIILIPKKPIQRMSEAVNLYLGSTLYGIFPQQGVAFNFNQLNTL